jgi:hypothetical protein
MINPYTGRNFSPYTRLMEKIKSSARSGPEKWGNSGYHREEPLDVTITLQDIEDVHNKQNSICPVCNCEYFLTDLCYNPASPQKPSSDRIRSEEAYIKGNLQITHQGCNYMKSNHNHTIANEFINNIKNKNFKPLIKCQITNNKGDNMLNTYLDRIGLLAAKDKDLDTLNWLSTVDSKSITNVSTNTPYEVTKRRAQNNLNVILAKNPSIATDTTSMISMRELAKKSNYKSVDYSSIMGGLIGKEMANGLSVYRVTGDEPTNNTRWLDELLVPDTTVILKNGK